VRSGDAQWQWARTSLIIQSEVKLKTLAHSSIVYLGVGETGRQEGHRAFKTLSETVRLRKILAWVRLDSAPFSLTDFVAPLEEQCQRGVVREEQSERSGAKYQQGLNTFICFGRRVPSLLEYFGYTFHHSMLLAGPACTFNDYIDFIEGRDIARATEQVSVMSRK